MLSELISEHNKYYCFQQFRDECLKSSLHLSGREWLECSSLCSLSIPTRVDSRLDLSEKTETVWRCKDKDCSAQRQSNHKSGAITQRNMELSGRKYWNLFSARCIWLSPRMSSGTRSCHYKQIAFSKCKFRPWLPSLCVPSHDQCAVEMSN